MQTVRVEDFSQWREAARALLAAGVAPHAVDWADARQASLLAGAQPASPPDAGQVAEPDGLSEPAGLPPAEAEGPVARVSRALLERLEQAGRHRDRGRWALMYRVLWRLAHGEPEAASEADADGARVAQMAAQVRREIHRMHAFLRFRETDGGEAGGPLLVAWFEPEHAVLDAVVPHFVERLGARPFAIVTPEARAWWDGEQARLEQPAPGERFEPPPSDDDPAWQAYYRSTFNPSRANPGLLVRQMPLRYWKNLPEARLIPGLLSQVRGGMRPDAAAPLSTARRGATLPAPRPQAACAPAAAGVAEAPLLQQCRRCDLWRQATQAVGGEGRADARLLLVGEQPGDEDDLRGRPFAGPAGRMLDQAIAAAGLRREDLYVTNAVKHFKWEPRGKRRIHKTPGQREIEACNGWLREELAAVAAPVVVSLGATALGALHRAADQPRPTEALGTLVGQRLQLGERWLVPTFHPSYVLRLPEPAQQQIAFERIVESLQQAARLAA